MANFLSVGIPSAILGALGSGQEQRERADRLAQIEAQRRYQAERLGLDRETLAETRRQSDLKYGPVTVNVPGVGEITAQREFIPSLIAAASAREKDISPEEVTALTGYRDRALLPAGGTINRGGIPWDPTLEAEASRQAMNQTRVLPKSTEGISPMTVDLPQTSVPRQSFERVMTEAAQVRKEREGEERKNKQGLSNARYRQIYSTAISQKVSHPVADAFAIDMATKEFGVAPEREAFAARPPEAPQPTEVSLALQSAGGDATKALAILKKQKREVGRSKVDLALEMAGGDAAKAIAILDRDEQRERDSAWSKASGILTQARNMRAQEQGRFGKIIMDPAAEEEAIARIANQLAVGTGDPLVQQIVRNMMGGLGGGVQPPGLQPPAAPPAQPRPAPAVRPAAPAGAAEQLSRRDARYGRLQGRGLSDQQIEAQFGVKLVP